MPLVHGILSPLCDADQCELLLVGREINFKTIKNILSKSRARLVVLKFENLSFIVYKQNARSFLSPCKS